jgi:crossover junction endodeoxyribonuclease RuvC
LGLDPGTRITGWGLVEGDARLVRVLEHGRLHSVRDATRACALASLSEQLDQLLRRLEPDIVVLETSFAARFPKAALALAETRGALLAVLGAWGGEVAEYEPAKVKAAVVGHGRAEKRQVAYVVKHLLGLRAIPPEDAADALALALCHLRSNSP